MKILALVDGSPCSSKAIEYLSDHTEWLEKAGKLHLLHVHPPIPGGLARSIVGINAIHTYYMEESKEALAPSETFLGKKGIAYEASYTVGRIEEEVQNFVRENGIELIVMGSHGHSELRNLVMGSTATRVLTVSKVPVLIVR